MQHILITGGNSGIGKATAIALAKNSARIIITSRNKAKANQAVIEIKEESKNEEVIKQDAKQYHELENLFNSKDFIELTKQIKISLFTISKLFLKRTNRGELFKSNTRKIKSYYKQVNKHKKLIY